MLRTRPGGRGTRRSRREVDLADRPVIIAAVEPRAAVGGFAVTHVERAPLPDNGPGHEQPR
jgi:hypothetical protein